MYFPPEFWRLIGTDYWLSRASAAVSAGLLLWLLQAMVRKPPAAAALRLYGPLTLWIGSPAVLGWAIRLAAPYSVALISLGLWLYTVVYGALLIGNRLRLVIVNADRTATPKMISLRVPAVVAAVLVALLLSAYINYGLGVPPGELPALAFYGLIVCTVATIGFLLTTDHIEKPAAAAAAVPFYIRKSRKTTTRSASALPIIETDSIGNFPPHESISGKAPVETLRCSDATSLNKFEPVTSPAPADAKVTSALVVRETNDGSASVPVPTIPTSNSPQTIRLKLKRSQRQSLMGKVIFVLDARVELTAEEAGLIRKYRLGDDVIYESSNRKQRNDATLSHLEMSGSKTSFRDPVGSQLLGTGKTLYRLARAGVSASAAALSLRISINSLTAGVHVECKSIAELTEAETAIIEAARGVRDYLDLAETFDGREEILEF